MSRCPHIHSDGRRRCVFYVHGTNVHHCFIGIIGQAWEWEPSTEDTRFKDWQSAAKARLVETRNMHENELDLLVLKKAWDIYHEADADTWYAAEVERMRDRSPA